MTKRLTSVVFENGITFQWSGKAWKCLNSKGHFSPSPTEMKRKYGLRPVMKSLSIDASKEGKCVLLSAQVGQSLTSIMSKVSAGPAGVQFYPYHPLRVGYTLREVSYHCQRLAQNYSTLCIKSLNHDLYSQIQGKSIIAILDWVEPCYFEVEACLTSLVRAYELIRYQISNMICPSMPTPHSYNSLLEQVTNLQSRSQQDVFVKDLVLSSKPEFDKLKSYRDCLQHYTFLSAPLSQGILFDLEDGTRGCYVPLPDNPESKSFKAFNMDKSIDALGYCWEVTTHSIIFIGKLASYLWQEETKK